jgi:hypothetical protein
LEPAAFALISPLSLDDFGDMQRAFTGLENTKTRSGRFLAVKSTSTGWRLNAGSQKLLDDGVYLS